MTKDQIFNLYARNLQTLRNSILNQETLEGLYICPLCLNNFTIDQKEELTLDHIPPESLGGVDRECILTCKKCNNTTGIAEGRLAEFLILRNIIAGIRGNLKKIFYWITYHNNGIVSQTSRLPAYLTFNGKEFVITGVGGREVDLAQVINIDPSDMMGVSWNYRGNNGAKGSFFTALLKIAYLICFRELGYLAIAHPDMEKIREQILNPQQKIILRKGVGSGYSFPDDWVGINIITKPSHLRSFLVVFDLSYDSINQRQAVFLPVPGNVGLNIYENLPKEGNSTIEFSVVHLCGLGNQEVALDTQEGTFCLAYYLSASNS